MDFVVGLTQLERRLALAADRITVVKDKLRTFCLDLETLPGLMSALESRSSYTPGAMQFAVGVLRGAVRIASAIAALQDAAS